MSDSVIELPALPVVELKGAALCQDCNGISAAPKGACVRCGSRALLSLAQVLNRRSAQDGPCGPVFYESPKQRQARLKRALWVEEMV